MVERFRIGARYRKSPRPSLTSPRVGLRLWVPGVTVVVLLLMSGVVLSHPSNAATPAVVPSTTPALSFPTPIRHVFVVYLENNPRSTVLANGPFERYLATQYAQASHYYGVCHPSAPNYLAATSGDSFQCGSDQYKVYSTSNVVNLLSSAGLTNWTGYMQSMPTPCDTSNAKIYVVHHDPFLYYKNVVGNLTYCQQHVVNLNNLNNSIASGTVPEFAWITPNNLDNAANTSVAYADQWLHGFLSPLVNDSFFRSSVFFVTYDESSKSDTSGYNGTDGGNVYFAAVSPYSRMGYTDTVDSSPYNLLSTVEWLLGLGSTGHHDGTAAFPAMKSLFNFSTAPPAPTRYSVDGIVTDVHGTVPSGATLTWSNATGGGTISVNASGGFSTALPNGTYHFTASAQGFISSEENVTVAGASVSGLVFSLTAAAATLYSVQGYVSLRGGTPPTHPTVTWWNSTDRASIGTNASGGFSVALPNGTFEFEAFAPGFQGTAVNLSVAGAAVTGVTLVLVAVANGTYTAHVTVVNASSENPIDGATVAVRGNSTAAENVTDAAGTCSFSLANGTYRAWVNATGYTANVSSWTIGGVNVSYLYALVPSNASPSNSSGNSSGTVTPPAFPVVLQLVSVDGGVPVANRSCTVTNDGNGSVVPKTTDSQGALELLLPNGSYRFLVDVPGYSTASVALVVQGTMTTNLTVQVEPFPTYTYAPSTPGPAPLSKSSTVLLATIAGLLVASVAALGAVVIRRRLR